MTTTSETGAPGPGRPRALKVWEKAGPARTRLALRLQEYFPPRPATYTEIGAEAHVGGHTTISRIVSGESRPYWTVLEPLTDVMRQRHVEAKDTRAFPDRDHWYDLYYDAAVEAGKTPEPKDKRRPPGGPGSNGSGPGGVRPGGGRGPDRSGPSMSGRVHPMREAFNFATSKVLSHGGLHVSAFFLWLSLEIWFPSSFPELVGLIGLSYVMPQLRRLWGSVRLHLRALWWFLAAVITRSVAYRFRHQEVRKWLEHERSRDSDSNED